MNNKTKSLVLSGAAVALATPMSSALALDDVLGFGAWINYQYDVDDDASEDRYGDLDFESFNIYANHQHGDWFFDGEVRLGWGSFQGTGISEDESDAAANRSVIGIKELAIGRHYGEEWTMTVGKTEVPFTYSRFNFWPGERLASGFGDQYNPGIRFDFDPVNNPMDMSFMYIKSQNWGTDTTSLDDGTLGHWGSNDTYHKINTLVADLGFTQGDFRYGASLQAGQLANQEHDDFTAGEETETHWAAGLYTEGTVGAWDLAGQLVHYDQGDTDEFDDDLDITTQGSGQVGMLSAGFNAGDWYHYGDLTGRAPDSDRERDDTTYDLVLGSRYNYGPGFIYAELQLENITDQEEGVSGHEYDDDEYEFTQTVNLTMDYYF
ncbi:hypothetical protein [Halorhodospira sp. 9622]|uniref:hypothetical protein n=1 Tax=Halorhodospira sp. 9622 TaxID=2899136 RepID=UPI001EE8456F|nr:hypothetical protein [Halorhodospira sp. 9622]MCG5538198.1 hypothetical protein [Halorhodospira sp. 9622]